MSVRKACEAMLMQKRKVTPEEAADAIKEMMGGKAPHSQMAAFLAGLQVGSLCIPRTQSNFPRGSALPQGEARATPSTMAHPFSPVEVGLPAGMHPHR